MVGEPGVGKSRLVDEVVAQSSEVTVLRCDCERTGAETPYAPVRRLLHEVLGTSSAMDPNTVAKCLQDCVTASAPELAPWASLLGVVLDVTLPASPEVEDLEEQHRAERVPELVADLLERMVPIPAMFVVEDAHLADPASADVLAAIGRRTEKQALAPPGNPRGSSNWLGSDGYPADRVGTARRSGIDGAGRNGDA